jgi:hypothetical protein
MREAGTVKWIKEQAEGITLNQPIGKNDDKVGHHVP